jgi:membrane-bound lytic murein transglycosylase MltF
MAKIELRAVLFLGVLAALTACGGNKTAVPAGETAAAKPVQEAETPLPPSELDTQLPEGVRETFLRPFTGDLDEMVKRRIVRVGVTFNRTFYFVDKGVQRGVSYDYGQLMEERLNQHFKTGNKTKVHVIFVPVPRDMLGSALIDGKVDLVAAQVTVKPEFQKLVDFTNPTRMNVSEILVTGPGAPAIASVEDLSGKDVFTREKSTYQESLLALNEKFKTQGRPPVTIRTVPGNLEDDDLLEMVNAGLIPAIVVDDYLANFWKKVFPNLTVHEDVAIRTGGSLAVAVRKNSPQLIAALNTFLGNFGLGTAFGNQIERKYLVSTKYVKSAASEAERKKFQTLVQFFRKYSDQYKLDFLLMAAQGYQESQLDQNAKSQVGAIGVMQVMPATGQELKVGDITQTEANIHAGVKYMRVTEDAFFKDEPMDELNKGLFTFASYNAGPGRVRQLRKEAEKRGLNPNVWFGNVEQIASERIGRETVTYVANIYKYYIAYRLLSEEAERKAAAKETMKAKAAK